MNINQVRGSFVVYIIDSKLDRLDYVAKKTLASGYTTFAFDSFESMKKVLFENPPHLVVCHVDDPQVIEPEGLDQLLGALPEVKVVLMSSPLDYEKAVNYFEKGIFDVQQYPFEAGEGPFIRALDRGVEALYYYYMNEQLLEEQTLNHGGGTSGDTSGEKQFDQAEESNLVLLDTWHNQVSACNNQNEVIQFYLSGLSGVYSQAPVAFLKYIPSYHSLAIALVRGGQAQLEKNNSENLDVKSWRGLGIDLSSDDTAVPLSDISEPMKLPQLKDLVESALGYKEYFAKVFKINEEIKGVFLVLGNSEDRFSDSKLKIMHRSLVNRWTALQLEKRVHSLTLQDELTHCYNKPTFLKLMNDEIARSRRISLPVSLAVISVDQFFDKKQESVTQAGYLMRMIATILRRNGRTNDIIGRISESEFGLLLPHSNFEGCAIKAERLRRTVESADFSKVLGPGAQISLSIGVSEYPSHCHDGHELLQKADQALLEVKAKGHNKVCIAASSEGFVPDFVTEPQSL